MCDWFMRSLATLVAGQNTYPRKVVSSYYVYKLTLRVCARRQNINVLTLGSPNGIGVFFPNGLNGVITKPTGYNATDSGVEDIPKHAISSGQGCFAISVPALIFGYVCESVMRDCSHGHAACHVACVPAHTACHLSGTVLF